MSETPLLLKHHSLSANSIIAAALLAMLPAAARAIVFEIELVDTTGISGISLALDEGGEPDLVYADPVNEAARYARKSGGTWTYDTLNFAFFSEGDYPSIEIDAAGNPHAIYQATNLQFPAYVRKNGGVWAYETPAPGEQSGFFNSLELDSQGFPHFTDTIGGLTYMIRYHRRTAPGWTTEIVEAFNDISSSGTSLALDANDVPHVTYNGPGLALRYASRAGGVWTRETIEPSGCNVWAPIAFDGEGIPCVAYSTADGTWFARRVGGAWTIEAVTSFAPFGFSTLSMALDSEGEPHLLYNPAFSGNLYYARRVGGVWTEELIVDWENNVGHASTLVLDANDNPHIAFLDGTAEDIYYGRVPAATGVDGTRVGGGELARDRLRIQVSPNPSNGVGTVIRLLGNASAFDGQARGAGERLGTSEAAIFDTSGRLVRHLGAMTRGIGFAPLTWNVSADNGRALAPGVYFVRIGTEGATLATERLTIVR